MPFSADAGSQPGSLQARLDRCREAGFAGRESELQLFREFLSLEGPHRVLLIHGPGGVGKTSLLNAFGRRARAEGWAAVELSAHELPTGLADTERALRERGSALLTGGGVLILDDFEALAAWESWFRERFLAGLSDNVLLVIGGRLTPQDEWRTDPGWQPMTCLLELGDFSAAETRGFLARRAAGADRAAEVHAFTQGHPLAVALAAELLETDPDAVLAWEHQPDLVHGLVARHLRTLEASPQRAVLHAAVLLPHLDTPLLQTMVPEADAEGGLGWLRTLPFSREASRGIRLHELVSEALRVEMKRLEPERHAALLRRASEELGRRMEREGSEAAVRAYIHLMQDIPMVRDALPTAEGTGLFTAPCRPDDLRTLRDLVAHYEGPESRAWFDYWAERQPDGIAVLRDAEDSLAGMSFFIAPFRETDPTAWEDPAVAAFRDHLAEYAPLQPGEKAYLCRYVLTAADRLGASPAATQLRAYNTFYAMRTPSLAFSAVVVPREQGLDAMYRLINFPVLEGGDFRLGDQDYFLMGHDWRLEPASQWAPNTTERLLAAVAGRDPGGDPRPGLSRTAFREAVKAGLKGLAGGEGLAGNPLLESPLLNGTSAGKERMGSLARILTRGIERLEAAPEYAESARILHVTFLQGPSKQRATAARLGLSYGTYRRRLREAIESISDLLWECDRKAVAASAESDDDPQHFEEGL